MEPAKATTSMTIRPARESDLARLTEIYNYYIINTPITFDLDPVTVEDRRPWFAQFAATGPHRLLVAEDLAGDDGTVVGWAGSHQFRTRKAYDTTAETTIYCAPEHTGRGIGPMLYTALFDAIRGEDLHMAIGGITLPNDASVKLHERFGFTLAAHMHEVGRKFGRYWDVGFYEKRLEA
jgi:phosphinothricin acetyltransferase